MRIEITDAIPADVYDIRKVQRVAWLATYINEEASISGEDLESVFANDETEEGKKRIEERKKRYENPEMHTWVAKAENTIIGFCVATKKEDTRRVQALYVLPDYQGLGAGKELMQTALQWLGSDKDVYVNVASYNEKAIGFYETFGFVKTDNQVQDEVATLPTGKIIPETEMLKMHT